MQTFSAQPQGAAIYLPRFGSWIVITRGFGLPAHIALDWFSNLPQYIILQRAIPSVELVMFSGSEICWRADGTVDIYGLKWNTNPQGGWWWLLMTGLSWYILSVSLISVLLLEGRQIEKRAYRWISCGSCRVAFQSVSFQVIVSLSPCLDHTTSKEVSSNMEFLLIQYFLTRLAPGN